MFGIRRIITWTVGFELVNLNFHLLHTGVLSDNSNRYSPETEKKENKLVSIYISKA